LDDFSHFKNFESINSTHHYCAELLAKTNPDPFTAISADYQTAGEGQIGSRWNSDSGQNALISIIVYPEFINASSPYKLHIMASLAAVEVLKQYIDDQRIEIKWPNDIMVDRCKTTGILIKNTFLGRNIRNSIISFGMNVNQTNFDFLPDACATSIAKITGRKIDVPEVRYQLWRRLRQFYDMMEKGVSLREMYLLKLYGYEEEFLFLDLRDHQYKTGEIIDVEGSGLLHVKTGGDVVLYDFKEIKFLFR